MSTTHRIGLALAAVAAGVLVWVLDQRGELRELRAAPRGVANGGAGEAGSTPGSAAIPVVGDALPAAESRVELMALRAKVTELRERQKQLAGATGENARLRTRLATVKESVERGLPPDYIKRDQARNRGQTTPEFALETMLWAMQTGDTNAFLAVIPERARAAVAPQLAAEGVVPFSKRNGMLPGFRVVRRRELGPEDAELEVEWAPGAAQPMNFHREAGGWVVQF